MFLLNDIKNNFTNLSLNLNGFCGSEHAMLQLQAFLIVFVIENF